MVLFKDVDIPIKEAKTVLLCVDEKDGQLKHCSNLECAEPEIIY
jgi:hypothetical protein